MYGLCSGVIRIRTAVVQVHNSSRPTRQKSAKIYLDRSKPRSGPAPIQGLPKPTLDTRKPVPGNGTDAASVGGGKVDVDVGDPSLSLPLVLLKLREANGDCPKELATIGGASLGTRRKSRTYDNLRLQCILGSCKAAQDTRLIARAQRSTMHVATASFQTHEEWKYPPLRYGFLCL